MNSKNFFAALALAAFTAAGASAQTLSKTEFPMTEPAVKKVVVESVYYFAQRQYAPALPVQYVSTNATYDTPEATTIAAISAMKSKNFAWFRSLWDKGSQQMMADRDKQAGHTPEFWQAAWEKSLGGRDAQLTDRIDSGDYVIIAYRFVSPDPSVKPIELATVLKKQNDRWVLTQDLAADPVLLKWRTPDERLQQIARKLMPETGEAQ